MTIVVFLGPSVPRAEAETILDAIYLPPVRQADLLSAVTTYRPAAIGVIDGVFGQSLSVWHKEILFALERGIAVYGASSMGALRAVETEQFGMVGVGEVFRMYRSGELTDDDEVALTHGDEDAAFKPLSEPLVNIRSTLALALEQGVVDADEHAALIRVAKRLYFPERTIPRILEESRAAGLDAATVERAGRFLRSSYVDVKRSDAVELLERMARREWLQLPSAPFHMTRSHLFDALFNRDRTVRHEGVDVPLAGIAAHAALHLPDFDSLSSAALNRTLVGILAELLEAEVTDEEVARERELICRRVGVAADGAGLAEWAERQRLEQEELDALVRQLAVCRKLQRWLITRRYLERTTKMVLDELRLTGRFDECLAGAAFTEKVIREHHPALEQVDHADAGLPELLGQHMRETGLRIEDELGDWLERAGFKDVHDLRFELLRARLVRGVLRGAADELARTLDGLDGG